jgi:hypothetical protein
VTRATEFVLVTALAAAGCGEEWANFGQFWIRNESPEPVLVRFVALHPEPPNLSYVYRVEAGQEGWVENWADTRAELLDPQSCEVLAATDMVNERSVTAVVHDNRKVTFEEGEKAPPKHRFDEVSDCGGQPSGRQSIRRADGN